jgi:3-isopropylmalate/(R)-2-methylmalate dehydratase large subunit
MKATLAQKILARASGKTEVQTGEWVIADIDVVMAHNDLADIYPTLDKTGITEVWDPEKVVVLLDNQVPAPNLLVAESCKGVRDAVKRLKIKHYYGERAGICHQVLPEKGWALPGELCACADSHTTTYGAFGAAAAGIGATETAYAMATGKLWFKVPETIKFNMTGTLPPRVMAKDIILYIAGKYSSSVAEYKSVEFSGPVARQLSIASRMSMSNMGIDIGAKFAMFEPDEKVVEFLKGRTNKPLNLVKADPDAVYEKIYEIDVSTLEPQVSCPHAVDNVKPVSQVGEVKIDQAVLGSCTNGRLEDLEIGAEILKGKKVPPDVRLLVFPASDEVFREALKKGLIYTFVEAGALVCNQGCGPCMGQHEGVLAAGEVCIASTNRNFKGRMGSAESFVYLGSPATVVASAIEGRIADPRNY